jgi:FixJ family two-component response regulator
MNSASIGVPELKRSGTPSCTAPMVFVIDDDVSVRESLQSMLFSTGRHVETFTSAHEFLERERPRVPSCLVLDVNLPDLNGLELQRRIVASGVVGSIPIVFITGFGDVRTSVRAMKAGAVEFLQKPLDEDALLVAIEDALERSEAALAVRGESDALLERYASLSVRERDVMWLVIRGKLNKQVGGELGISEITVKAHRGRVMRKMRADSLADLVVMAGRLGERLTSIAGGKNPHVAVSD